MFEGAAPITKTEVLLWGLPSIPHTAGPGARMVPGWDPPVSPLGGAGSILAFRKNRELNICDKRTDIVISAINHILHFFQPSGKMMLLNALPSFYQVRSYDQIYGHMVRRSSGMCHFQVRMSNYP
jgi:hypothetical protein